MLARNDVLMGRLTISQASNKYGVHRTTIWRWIKRSKGLNLNSFIYTLPSIPKHHPNELNLETTIEIINLRKKLNRCAPIIQAHLKRNGIKVSISVIGKVLKKYKLTRKRKWIKDRTKFKRPEVKFLGSLVQMDTIHIVKSDYSRIYIYTVIDVFSRLGYAYFSKHLSASESIKVLIKAKDYFGFKFKVVQTDNGAEFSQSFGFRLNQIGIKLRHSRTRKPNDNAHIERFNRTIQEEGLRGNLESEKVLINKINRFIHYYNYKRLHLGINCQTPFEYVAKVRN